MAFLVSSTVILLILTTFLQVCESACVYNCTPVYSLWYLWLLVLGVIICVCGLCGHCYRRRAYARASENAETIQVHTANVNVTGVPGYYMNPDGTSSPVAPYRASSPAVPYPTQAQYPTQPGYPTQVPPPYATGGPAYPVDPNSPYKMAYATAPPTYADAIKTPPFIVPGSETYGAPANTQNDYSTANSSSVQNFQTAPTPANAPTQPVTSVTGQETSGHSGHQNMGYETQ